jgi:hypothetical protein
MKQQSLNTRPFTSDNSTEYARPMTSPTPRLSKTWWKCSTKSI